MQLMLNGISKSFKGKKVIENLNLEVSCGEILSLLGPSGCGKTTILKIIGGFVSPDSGEVILDGEDITHMMPEKRAVSTVFQSFALFPHMNVIDNITYGLKFKGYSKKERMVKGDEYLEIIGLKDDKTAMPSTLSGGQKQRVALGRSLILNPKILLLDEALSSLDAKLRIKMRSEIVDIGKKFNTTMIFVTHDQEEALSVSDRIAVMNNGRIEQIADPRELYENSSSHFVSSFIGEENIININGQIIRVRPED
ncbi:MAG: ABC transporter ATP-binding protein, partial [Clostridium sp.]